MSKKPLIDLVNISKTFDGTCVLDDLNLSIKENEFLTLLGPSGCGKTTTLRILGGFVTPDKGSVIFDGQDITQMPPNKRNLNTVFQKYALFPHMNIEENIAFGLKISHKSDAYIKDKIKYALKLVNLQGYEKRMPSYLSGGQQQRAAIARALVTKPAILLADEPTGNLDSVTSQDVLSLLKVTSSRFGQTVVMITHNEEIAQMADRIIRIEDGKIRNGGEAYA